MRSKITICAQIEDPYINTATVLSLITPRPLQVSHFQQSEPLSRQMLVLVRTGPPAHCAHLHCCKIYQPCQPLEEMFTMDNLPLVRSRCDEEKRVTVDSIGLARHADMLSKVTGFRHATCIRGTRKIEPRHGVEREMNRIFVYIQIHSVSYDVLRPVTKKGASVKWLELDMANHPSGCRSIIHIGDEDRPRPMQNLSIGRGKAG